MRGLGPTLLAGALLGAGCADLTDSLVMGGFLLGLPEESATTGNNAELVVFLGRGNTPLEVAANTVTDADLVQGVAPGVVASIPHVADGFYILTTGEDASLVYEPDVPWTFQAVVGDREGAVTITAPAPPALFGAPLDGTWTVDRELTLSLPTGEPDRAFAWVNAPTGEVTWSNEPVNTGATLQWLDEPAGVSEVVIPGSAFPTPGAYRVAVVAARDADPNAFAGLAARSAFAAGAAQTLELTVQ